MNRQIILIAFYFTIFTGLNLPVFSQKTDLKKLQKRIEGVYPQDIESSFQLVKIGLADAILYGDSLESTFFLDVAGEIYRIRGNYDSALFCLNNSLSLKANWTDLKDYSLTHNDLAKTYVNMGKYESAAFHFIEALKLMERSGNKLGQSFYLNNLGIVYDLQQNYLKSIEYYEKSLSLKKELGDTNAIAAVNINLGILYYNLGEFEASINALETSIRLYSDHPKRDKLARAYCNILLSYLANENLTKATIIREEIEKIYPEIVEEKLKIRALSAMARYDLKAGEIELALKSANKALDMAESIDAKANIKDIHLLKSDVFQAQNKLDSALLSLQIAMTYKDSLIDEKSIASVAEMESKYQNEKNKRIIKEQEIAQLKAKKKYENELQEKRENLLYLILVLVIAAGFLVVLLLRYRSKQKKYQMLMVQNALIDKRNKDLSRINEVVKTEIDGLKLSLDEKNKILENVVIKGTQKELSPELISLSKREMEVLCNLSLGYSDEELAESLHVSKSTVKTHLRRIYNKLLVKGRAEAIVVAHKYGLIGKD